MMRGTVILSEVEGSRDVVLGFRHGIPRLRVGMTPA
jgi:hypothetical protein